MIVGRSFLRRSLHLPPCSLHPLLLVLSSVALEDGYRGIYLPTNHRSKALPLPHAASFKMLQGGLSF